MSKTPVAPLSYFIFLLAFFVCMSSSAQQSSSGESTLGTKSIKKNNRLEFNNALFYSIGENRLMYGFTLKYIRRLAGEKFDIGIGYEKLWDTHRRSTLGIVGVYHPVQGLSIGALFGKTYSRQPDNGPMIGVHIETAYLISHKKIRFGPTSEIGYNNSDAHFSFGVTTSYSF